MQSLILKNCFLFPKTETLKDDKPIIFFETIKFDIDELKKILDKNKESLSSSAMNELKLIVDVIEQIKDDYIFYLFDTIRIYRFGLNILCIKLNNDCKKSACLNIKDYQEKLCNKNNKLIQFKRITTVVFTSFTIAFILNFIF